MLLPSDSSKSLNCITFTDTTIVQMEELKSRCLCKARSSRSVPEFFTFPLLCMSWPLQHHKMLIPRTALVPQDRGCTCYVLQSAKRLSLTSPSLASPSLARFHGCRVSCCVPCGPSSLQHSDLHL